MYPSATQFILLLWLFMSFYLLLVTGQNFGDSSSIPQSFSDSGNSVQRQALQFADLPAPLANTNSIQSNPVGNPVQQVPSTNTVRETRIVTNIIREVPVQRTVPLRSHVLPIDPVIAPQPLVQSAAVPPPVVSPGRRRSRGRRPVPSTPISDLPINPCDQVKDSGPCFDVYFRWAYNPTTGKCHEFIYGGCGGNGNQFTNAQECMNTCGTTQYQTLGLQPVNQVVSVIT